MKKVTGIGGVFFKCKDPKATRAWYQKNLGLNSNEYGATFEWRLTDKPEQRAYSQWSPFKEDTNYFAPSEKPLMVNFRVENLEALLEELRKDGVQIVGEIATYEYGKFAHILDPDGYKVELWEPVDSVFDESEAGKTTF